MQYGMAALLGGATIWATHFIAMMAYVPDVGLSYDVGITLWSFVIAVVGVSLAVYFSSVKSPVFSVVLSGATFGMTIVIMHYVGMMGVTISGTIAWNLRVVVLSASIGILLGIVMFQRMLHPVTRYCWLGATVAMTLAVTGMHFTGMSAIEGFSEAFVVDPSKAVSNVTLSMIVTGVIALILMIGQGAALIETSISDDANKRLFAAARRDMLTNLPNRLQMDVVFETLEAQQIENPDLRLAVLTINLDQFKQVNDLFGHWAGDKAIKLIAERLRICLVGHEFVARTSGDEFVAVKWGYQRPDEVWQFAQKIRAQMVEPVSLSEGDCLVGASVGIAMVPEDGEELPPLLQKSGLAMYRAKADVNQKVQFFDAEMEQRSKDAIALTHDLRLAMARGEFSLNFQMQNDLKTHEVVGFEVLLRWDHSKRGRVPPSVFIPIAEETGLICEIGLWVMRTACEEAARWSSPCRIAVNVAPQQLVQPQFVEKVAEILKQSGLQPNFLEIEITEASIIDDQKYTLDVMHRLKEMGIRIAMDDFGTGYSSLSTLQAFPFDKIKIDRSFISNVHINPQRAAIVRSTLLLGAALNVPILAEGTEQAEELEFLRAENCAEVQGYYFGKPMSVEDVRKLVRKIAKKRLA